MILRIRSKAISLSIFSIFVLSLIGNPSSHALDFPGDTLVMPSPWVDASALDQRDTKSVVFIDASVEDSQTLADEISSDHDLVFLDALRPPLEQMTEALQRISGGEPRIEAVHIFSHGRPGTMVFAAGTVDVSTVTIQAEVLHTWKNYLADGADLLLYGCELGKGIIGDEKDSLISVMANATGADVAVSTDFTGATGLGGNWKLELQTGKIEANSFNIKRFGGLLLVVATSSPTISEVTFSGTPLNVDFIVDFQFAVAAIGSTLNMNVTAPSGWSVSTTAAFTGLIAFGTQEISITITSTGTDTNGSFPVGIYSTETGLPFGNEIAGSTVTVNVDLNSAPTNTIVPSITGTATVGNVLNASTGTWTDANNDTLTYSYQWYRSDDSSGTNEAAISGATESSYTLTSAENHKFIRVVVTASDSVDSVMASSNRTAEINTPPTNTVIPAISGILIMNSTLTTDTGTWSDADGDTLTFTYQWRRADDSSGTNETNISGANSSSYVTTTADAHKFISVTVTANDAHGSNNQTTDSIRSQVANSAPFISTGAGGSGSGSFTGSEPTMSPRFFRSGTPGNSSATFSSGNFQHQTVEFTTDSSGQLSVDFNPGTLGTGIFVTFHTSPFNPASITENHVWSFGSSQSFNEMFTVPTNTLMLMVVSGVANAPGVVGGPYTYSITGIVSSPYPAINGTKQVGNTLTATNGVWNDPDNDTLSYTYQWYRADDGSGTNSTPITGANSSSYTLTTSDAHKYLRVVVTANDGTVTADGQSDWTQILNSIPAITPPTAINLTDTTGLDTYTNQSGVLAVTDADADTLTYGITGGNGGGNFSSGGILYNVFLAGSYGTLHLVSTGSNSGSYVYEPNASAINALVVNASETFTLSASDGIDSPTAALTVNITGVDDTTVLESNNLTLNEGASVVLTSSHLLTKDNEQAAGAFIYTVTAVPAHGTLSLSGNALIPDATFTQDDINQGRVAYAHDGSETTSDSFHFKVVDGIETSFIDVVFAITVIPINDAPYFVTPSPSSTSEDLPFSYSFVTGDSDTSLSALTLTTVNLPSWLSFTPSSNGTGTLSGIPRNENVGANNVTLRINDGELNTDFSFVLTVVNVNDAPNFTSTPVTTAQEGQLYLYHLTSTDEDSNQASLILQAFQKPFWLTLVDNGNGIGTLSGTPGAAQVGTHTLILWVQDGQNLDEQTFTITVLPAPTATPMPTNTITPTPEPTATATETATPEPTATATETATPEPTATATETATPEPTATATETATPEPTATATETSTPEPTAIATETSTPEPTATATYTATPEPTATETPEPTATATETATPMPTATHTATATATPTSTTTPTFTATPSVTPTPTPQYEILIDWNLEDFGTPLSDILDIHIYVQEQDGLNTGGLNQIGEFFYLGRTDDGNATSFTWRANAPLVASQFTTGPDPVLNYNFQIWILVRDGDDVKFQGAYSHFRVNGVEHGALATPTPTVTPTHPSDSTPTPTPTNVPGFVTTDDSGIVIRWDLQDFTDLLGSTVDIHVYVRTNFGEVIEGLNQIDGYYYLGQTGNGTSDFFTWRKGYPGIHPVFAEGPQAGQAYEFQLYFIQGENGETRYEGPFQSFTAKEYGMPVTVHDTLQSEDDLSGDTDYDTATQRSLTVRWDLSQEPLNEDSILQIHVYVRSTTQSDFDYLGQTTNGQAREMEWRVNGPLLAPAFRVGPQFGQDYEFRVFAIRNAAMPYGPLETEGPLAYRAAVEIYDDAAGQEELSGGVDLDPAGQEALAIRWSIDETALNDADVKEYHVYVQTDGADNYVYLGKSGAAQSELLWTLNGAGLHKNFRAGPTAGHAYAFRVFALSLTAGQRPYGPFDSTGAVSLQNGEAQARLQPQAPAPTPTVTPIPSATPTPR